MTPEKREKGGETVKGWIKKIRLKQGGWNKNNKEMPKMIIFLVLGVIYLSTNYGISSFITIYYVLLDY